MKDEQLLALLAQALEIDPARLDRSTRIEDLAEWDSLGWLTIMSLLDEQLEIQLEVGQLQGLETVGDFLDYLQQLH